MKITKIIFTGADYEPTVNEVKVPVLDRNLCNAWLKQKDVNITDGMICAGYEEGGKDACQVSTTIFGSSIESIVCRLENVLEYTPNIIMTTACWDWWFYIYAGHENDDY